MGNVTSGCWPSGTAEAREECETDEGASNKVELAASLLFTIPGLASAYHTSVVVNGEEFFFSDSGIFHNMSLTSHQSQPSEKFELGFSKWTGHQLLLVLQKHFRPGTYDLIRKNCNSFSDCALYFLLGKRLPAKYSALESIGQRASMDLLQRFTNGAYQPNQEAVNFSIDTVIQHLDRLDKSTISSSPNPLGAGKQALKNGAMVIVCGLKNAEHLNGQTARIVNYNPVNGRWEAQLEGATKAFRAENLRPAGDLVLLPGQQCRIQNLQSETGKMLNGRVGEVNRYIHDVSRYEVLVDGVSKSIKAENLQAV